MLRRASDSATYVRLPASFTCLEQKRLVGVLTMLRGFWKFVDDHDLLVFRVNRIWSRVGNRRTLLFMSVSQIAANTPATSFAAGGYLELRSIALRPGEEPAIEVGGLVFRGVLGKFEPASSRHPYSRYQINVPEHEVAKLMALLADRDPTVSPGRPGLFRHHQARMVTHSEGGAFPIDNEMTQLDLHFLNEDQWAQLTSITPLADDMTMKADVATAGLVAYPARINFPSMLHSAESKRAAEQIRSGRVRSAEPSANPEVALAAGRLLRNFVGSPTNRKALGAVLGINSPEVASTIAKASDEQLNDFVADALASGSSFQARFATFAGRARGDAVRDVITLARHASTAAVVAPIAANFQAGQTGRASLS